MPQNYYPDEEVEDEREDETEDSSEEMSPTGDTALVSKSMLPEVKVGDTVTLKVVHIYEDEIELEKVQEEKTTPERPGYEAELDALAQEGE